MIRKFLFIALCLCFVAGIRTLPAQAATTAEIEQSIQKGITYLVGRQNANGSWNDTYYTVHSSMWVGVTGMALTKLVERAHELGQDPFDTNSYAYADNVIRGYNYLFAQAANWSGSPATSLYIGGHVGYENGISLMAIAATKEPNKVVSSSNGLVNGLTYKQVLQKMVDYTVWSQSTNGGWHYTKRSGSDNSPCGYTVLGLRYAEASSFGFNCTVPANTKTRLKSWVDYIQNDSSGGSGYTSPNGSVNSLKTGNLLFEAAFADPNTAWETGVVSEAVRYIQNNWNIIAWEGWRGYAWWNCGQTPMYQAMYNMMKGFQSQDIDEITVGGNTFNWFSAAGEFADTLVNTQNTNGSWPCTYAGGDVLATSWALLTLEKLAPPPPINVDVVLADEICDNDSNGYTVTVNYTSETANVDGTLVVKKGAAIIETVNLVNFNGTASKVYSGIIDSAGPYTWTAVMKVWPNGSTEADGPVSNRTGEATIEVIDTPVVSDIPDQTTPFSTFDLDDFVTATALPVTWTNSGVPAGWTINVDVLNVVTVTAPAGATTPVTITFTACVTGANGLDCCDSDSAKFTPNRPPVADAGPDQLTVEQTSLAGADVTLDGSLSSDPDAGDALTYAWTEQAPGTITATGVNPVVSLSLGTHTFDLVVNDGIVDSENTDSVTIIVVDTTDPVLSGVPGDTTAQCDNIPAAATPSATDICDAAPDIEFSGDVRTDGDCLDSYTITRTWTATDASGNSSEGVQVITVEDTTPPVLSGVPGDTTAQCDNIPAAANPSASDNCDPLPGIDFSGDVRTDGKCDDSYTITRTWTATDRCGNESVGVQVITVEDTTAPVLSGVPANETVECDSVPAAATPSASDNCDPAPGIAYAEVRTDGDCPDNYTLTRTWTATDRCGNESVEVQVITVQDTTEPVVTATLVPVKVKKKHGCFRVEFSATDNCDDDLDVIAQLNGHDVEDGELVRLHHKKPHKKKGCRMKVDDGSSGHSRGSSDDDSSSGHRHGSSDDGSSADCGTKKFECNEFKLTVTATDDCTNSTTVSDDFVFPSKHDGHSHDDNGIHRGNKKKDNHKDHGKHKSEGKRKKH